MRSNSSKRFYSRKCRRGKPETSNKWRQLLNSLSLPPSLSLSLTISPYLPLSFDLSLSPVTISSAHLALISMALITKVEDQLGQRHWPTFGGCCVCDCVCVCAPEQCVVDAESAWSAVDYHRRQWYTPCWHLNAPNFPPQSKIFAHVFKSSEANAELDFLFLNIWLTFFN